LFAVPVGQQSSVNFSIVRRTPESRHSSARLALRFVAKADINAFAVRLGNYHEPRPGRGSRSNFFYFQSPRTLSKIAVTKSQDHQSEMTTNPITHKLRATVKNTMRNAILKI
jgi:hypothetical protein